MTKGERAIAEDLLGCIPTNWCDPLLTGPDKVLPSTQPYRADDIERLLLALRERMEQKLSIYADREDAERYFDAGYEACIRHWVPDDTLPTALHYMIGMDYKHDERARAIDAARAGDDV